MKYAQQVAQYKKGQPGGFHFFIFLSAIPFIVVLTALFAKIFPILALESPHSFWAGTLFISFLIISSIISFANVASLWIVFRKLKPTAHYVHNSADASIEVMFAKSLFAPFLIIGLFLQSLFITPQGFGSFSLVLVLSGVFAVICSFIVFVAVIISFSTVLYRKNVEQQQSTEHIFAEKQTNATMAILDETKEFYVSKTFSTEWSTLQNDVSILQRKETVDIELGHYISSDLEKLAHVMQLFDQLTLENQKNIQQDIMEMFLEAEQNVKKAIHGVEQGVLLEIKKTKALMKR